MKQNNRFGWIHAPLVLGGLLWMGGGVLLALRPGGHPPNSFRATMDLMPLLGAGLFLIGGSLGVQCLRLPHRGARSSYIAAAFFLTGALFYPAGIFVRTVIMEGRWEPLMPIGFLLIVAGCGLYGLTTWITHMCSRAGSLLLLGAALSLLAFNDQYTPWMGSVFGLVVTAFGCAGELGANRLLA